MLSTCSLLSDALRLRGVLRSVMGASGFVGFSLGLCGALSDATFTHTGYTGTQICADPTRRLLTVLLTNRVYPRADDRSEAAIHSARIAFNDAVVRAVSTRE